MIYMPSEVLEKEEEKDQEVEKQEEENEDTRLLEIIDQVFSSHIIFTADIMSKINLYLQLFGTAMRTLKEREPKVWAELILSVKRKYQKNPADFDTAIELIATGVIEYETFLLSGKTSPFTTQLYNYAKINNLLYR